MSNWNEAPCQEEGLRRDEIHGEQSQESTVQDNQAKRMKLHIHYHVETQQQSDSLLPHIIFPTAAPQELLKRVPVDCRSPFCKSSSARPPASRHTDNPHYSQRDNSFLQTTTTASEKQRVSVTTHTIFFLSCRGQPDSDAVCWISMISKA